MKRIHIAIGVKNVDSQIIFYTKLFGETPICHGNCFHLGSGRQVYGAQWRLPYINFCIFQDKREISRNRYGIDHLGIECAEEYEVADHLKRVIEYEFKGNRWVKDPNKIWWELFKTNEINVK